MGSRDAARVGCIVNALANVADLDPEFETFCTAMGSQNDIPIIRNPILQELHMRWLRLKDHHQNGLFQWNSVHKNPCSARVQRSLNRSVQNALVLPVHPFGMGFGASAIVAHPPVGFLASTHLDSKVFRNVILHKLQLPVQACLFNGCSCMCGAQADLSLEHYGFCLVSGGINHRHSLLVSALSTILKQIAKHVCSTNVSLVRFGIPSPTRRGASLPEPLRADVTAIGGFFGTERGFFDVSIMNTRKSDFLAMHVSDELIQHERTKDRIYRDTVLQAGFKFFPIILADEGVFGPSLLASLNSWAVYDARSHGFSSRNDIASHKAFKLVEWKTILSTALWQGNIENVMRHHSESFSSSSQSQDSLITPPSQVLSAPSSLTRSCAPSPLWFDSSQSVINDDTLSLSQSVGTDPILSQSQDSSQSSQRNSSAVYGAFNSSSSSSATLPRSDSVVSTGSTCLERCPNCTSWCLMQYHSCNKRRRF